MNINNFFDYQLINTSRIQLTVYEVLMVIVAFLVGFLLVQITKKILYKKAESKSKSNAGRYYAFAQLLKYLIYIITIFAVLDLLGINMTMFKTGSAALLVGLGFGLQHTFNDFVSGVIILAEGSLQVGNIVEVDNLVGRVKHIGMRTSRITTRDGVTIIVPNSKFVSENVVNWSHQHVDRTRFMIRFSVGVDADVNAVKKILLDIAGTHNDVVKNPAPKVRLFDFSESGYVFDLLFWTSNMFFVETVKSDMRFMMVEEFRKKDIRISFPHREIIQEKLPED
jgi:small-conductance mechanosensitive channel